MIVVLPLALPRQQAHLCCMFSILASIIGFIALLLMIPTVLPFLGWAHWLIVPIALLGAVIGSLSSSNVGRNFCLIVAALGVFRRSDEHTSELQSLMRISYAVFCLKKKTNRHTNHTSDS